MNATVYTLIRALSGLETGRACRRCSEAIPRDDHFGIGEAVCRGCRRA